MNIIKCILAYIESNLAFFILIFMEYPYYNMEYFKILLNESANQKSKLKSYVLLLMILLKLILGLFLFLITLLLCVFVTIWFIGLIIQYPLIVISIVIIVILPYVIMIYLRKK